MKTILLFGAGKSATVLIEYLIAEAGKNGWKVIIADADKAQILSKTNHSTVAEAVGVDIRDDLQRTTLIQQADVVISLLPPTLHFLVAKDCVGIGKHLLTASYLDNDMRTLADEISNKNLLFLCEMGLDPGIDHMSAMQLIDKIESDGGSIHSFKSHCGGLVAPESNDNPWQYKISWNPRNIVIAGSSGAEYKLNNNIQQVAYTDLFDQRNIVNIDGLGELAFYPNRDSLSYIPVYQLPDAATFVRTTLRYPVFMKGWSAVVRAGLTDFTTTIDVNRLTFARWSASILPFITSDNKPLLQFLGLFDEAYVPATARTSADILQYLLETKLAMRPQDKDMIVMLHEIEYEINSQKYATHSSLIVKGENGLHTAMAKTVGLPLGIAAVFILTGKINLTGLHIPTKKEIYKPVLQELEKHRISFTEYNT